MAKVSGPAPDEEVDDYMSMTITEPSKPSEKETYTQRRIRKQREVTKPFLYYFGPS